MAQLLDGKAIAHTVKEEIRRQVDALKKAGVAPKLAVILVGDDPASAVYARSKRKAAAALGIAFELFALPADTEEKELLALIRRLNEDEDMHGIMIELPLPGHLAQERVFSAVHPYKDVDGVHPVNRGHLLSGAEGILPATPQSCLELLRRYGIEMRAKHAVIVGRGDAVGKPLVFMALRQDATVTVCHSKTPDLGYFTRQADILFVAAGRAGLITRDMVKAGAAVVDAGINETPGGICGDVDFNGVREVAGFLSPVPGGVGALTTALLMKNLLKGISLQRGIPG